MIIVCKNHQSIQEWEVWPDDVRGGQGGQQSHGQTEAEVIGPVSLNIGQPLVHLDTFNKQKEPQLWVLPSIHMIHFGFTM